MVKDIDEKFEDHFYDQWFTEDNALYMNNAPQHLKWDNCEWY